MEGEVAPSPSVLADLCQALGASVSDLVAAETPRGLLYTFPVTRAAAAALDMAQVRGFSESWTDVASIEIRTGELTEIRIDADVTDAAVAAFKANAAAAGSSYEADVIVDKARLTSAVFGDGVDGGHAVFVSSDALHRSLARGLAWFEDNVWTNAPGRLTIAVLDTNIQLDGAYLRIVGGSRIGQASASSVAEAVIVDVSAARESRERFIGWDSLAIRMLTPWHFDVSGVCDDEELLDLLRAQLVKLAVLYTCDRARTRGSGGTSEILAEYRGGGHVAVVPIDEAGGMPLADHEVAAVLHAVTWCYERQGERGQPDWVSDRLPFIQTRVAQWLEPRQLSERLAAFTHSMPELLEGIEWSWKAFIEGRVSEYLTGVRQVESVVSDTVAAFEDRTATLIKGLTDSMLAAVAVLVGSFIASAFHSPFNGTLFQISVLTYAAYVLVFPGAISLFASNGSMKNARTEFDTRIAQFRETLYREKVDEIVGRRVECAQERFRRWMVVVAIAYVVVAAAAVVAARTVPSHVHVGAATGVVGGRF